MQQIIKKFQPLLWITVIMFSVVFATGCGGDTQKTETPATEEVAPANVDTPATDSLPKLDTSATSRPEGIKTVTKSK